jgi:hypothetical protein
MSKQIINVGSGELVGDGEGLRPAFIKINANFDEVYADIAAIPEDLSGFNNDVGYITTASIPTNVSAFNNDVEYITTAAFTTTNIDAFINNVEYITAASIPTNVSAFNNDVEYITTAAFTTTNIDAFINNVGYITASSLPATDRISSGTVSAYITPDGTFTIPGNIVPNANAKYTLGLPESKFRSVYVGTGSVYIEDITLGTNAELTVENGVLYVNGAFQLQVGQLKFFENTIESTTGATDIQIGLTTSTANLVLNRNTVIATGKTLTFGSDINSLQTTAFNDRTAVTRINAGNGLTQTTSTGVVGIDATGVQTVVGTPNRVIVTDSGSKNLTLTTPQDLNTTASVTFQNITVTGNINVLGTSTVAQNSVVEGKILYLASSATNAAQINGGGIQLGTSTFARSILYAQNSGNDYWYTDPGTGFQTEHLTASTATFTDLTVSGNGHFGTAFSGYEFDNAAIQADGNVNNFMQIVIKNHNTGTSASSDFVASNNLGTDSANFIDMGINSSQYANPDYSITEANDGYLFVEGGSLAVGTASVGTEIRFHTGGTTSDKLRARITDAGLNVVGTLNGLTLPSTSTTAGYVLTNNGSGVTSWVAPNTGPRGPQGPQGVQGVAGADGASGPSGPQGLIGVQGNTGPTGPSGAQGNQGNQGTQGDTGSRGPQGPTGAQGNVGSVGPSGPQGLTGAQGAAGAVGPSGPQGLEGIQGLTGSSGPQGPSGAQGNVGSRGPQGPSGPSGAQGNEGPTGAQGNQGNQGNTGPSGPIGPIGPSGPNGIQGLNGPQGPQGPQGNQGNTGVQGPQGPQGNQGAASTVSGPSGPSGPAGVNGVTSISTGTGISVTTSTGAVTVSLNTATVMKEAVSLVAMTSILAGTLAMNPTTINKGVVATQTFTITGLTTSHKVIITPAAAMPDKDYFIKGAWASATNTLSVEIYNASGGNIDAASINVSYIAFV